MVQLRVPRGFVGSGKHDNFVAEKAHDEITCGQSLMNLRAGEFARGDDRTGTGVLRVKGRKLLPLCVHSDAGGEMCRPSTEEQFSRIPTLALEIYITSK